MYKELNNVNAQNSASFTDAEQNCLSPDEETEAERTG
jgi:hypothetical protein